ncbi:MAG TPA: MOSC domain-containing protein [Rubrivivax sp.]|nr:MOSC domain-containing protein [Rubrivivax sp.]
MRSIRDLAVPPQTGRIQMIVVRGRPRDVARTVQATQALPGIGLADDRLGLRGETKLWTRQVTLIQQEHLAVIAQLAGVPVVDPIRLRRNLVVSGINLLALKNQHVRVGGALLQIVGPCAPCSRMEDEVGVGAYAALRGHGGMTARVLEGGLIEVDSTVTVEPPGARPGGLATSP